MGKTPLVHLLATASLLGAVWIWNSQRAAPGDDGERELRALQVEVARITARLDALAVPGEDGASGARQESGDLERLSAEVRALRRQLDGIARAPERPEGSAARGGGGPAETLFAEARLAEHLEEVLRRESEGAEARSLAATLAERIRGALPHGASLREVRCRPSLCRAEMSYPDVTAFQEFVESSLNGGESGVWPGATFLQSSDPELQRGDVIVQAYLARDERILTPPPAR